jgi:hypothetical protein
MKETKIKKLTKTKAKKMVAQAGGIRKAARQLGVAYSSLHDLLNDRRACGYVEYSEEGGTYIRPTRMSSSLNSKLKKVGRVKRIKLEDLQKSYDPVVQIQGLLSDINEGEFISDIDLFELSSLSKTAFTRARRDNRLLNNQIRLPDGGTIWGSTEDIQSAKKVLTRGIYV